MNLKEAAKKAGVPYPTAARWAQFDILRADGGGISGRPWECSPRHVRQLQIINRLRDVMRLEKLQQAADTLEELGRSSISGRFLIVKGGEFIRIAGVKEVQGLISGPGDEIIIQLGEDPITKH